MKNTANPRASKSEPSKEKTKAKGFEKKETDSGKPNPKYVDLLEEDKPIAGQKFACVSFVSPENILQQKNTYFFNEFVKTWDIHKSMEKFTSFLHFLSFKYHLPMEEVMKDLEDFVKDEKAKLTLSTLEDDYKTYLDKNEDSLENKFNIEHEFQTSVRGLKIRGVFPTEEEAKQRCKMLHEIDPYFNISICSMGMWVPWDPEPYKTSEVVYSEEELNQLMAEKKKNEMVSKNNFEQHIKETRKKAIEENIEKAEKSGNVLTQTLDEAGNLVGVRALNTTEAHLQEKEGEGITQKDVQHELFAGDNILTEKSDNGVSQLVSGPFSKKK